MEINSKKIILINSNLRTDRLPSQSAFLHKYRLTRLYGFPIDSLYFTEKHSLVPGMYNTTSRSGYKRIHSVFKSFVSTLKFLLWAKCFPIATCFTVRSVADFRTEMGQENALLIFNSLYSLFSSTRPTLICKINKLINIERMI